MHGGEGHGGAQAGRNAVGELAHQRLPLPPRGVPAGADLGGEGRQLLAEAGEQRVLHGVDEPADEPVHLLRLDARQVVADAHVEEQGRTIRRAARVGEDRLTGRGERAGGTRP